MRCVARPFRARRVHCARWLNHPMPIAAQTWHWSACLVVLHSPIRDWARCMVLPHRLEECSLRHMARCVHSYCRRCGRPMCRRCGHVNPIAPFWRVMMRLLGCCRATCRPMPTMAHVGFMICVLHCKSQPFQLMAWRCRMCRCWLKSRRPPAACRPTLSS